MAVVVLLCCLLLHAHVHATRTHTRYNFTRHAARQTHSKLTMTPLAMPHTTNPLARKQYGTFFFFAGFCTGTPSNFGGFDARAELMGDVSALDAALATACCSQLPPAAVSRRSPDPPPHPPSRPPPAHAVMTLFVFFCVPETRGVPIETLTEVRSPFYFVVCGLVVYCLLRFTHTHALTPSPSFPYKTKHLSGVVWQALAVGQDHGRRPQHARRRRVWRRRRQGHHPRAADQGRRDGLERK